MKILKFLVAGIFCIIFLSCSQTSSKCSLRCQEYFNSHQTAQQGVMKARLDMQSDGFKIYRYDMPPHRSGAWSKYYARYEHFGIEELGGGIFSVPTLDFMKAYNEVMDDSLTKKYGSEYLKYRVHLIPKKDATTYNYDRVTKS